LLTSTVDSNNSPFSQGVYGFEQQQKAYFLLVAFFLYLKRLLFKSRKTFEISYEVYAEEGSVKPSSNMFELSLFVLNFAELFQKNLWRIVQKEPLC